MLTRIFIFFVLTSGFLFSNTEFTPDESMVEKALKGEQVAVVTKLKGFVWPEVIIYDTIESTAEEAMAIFTDYPLQKTYVPRLIKADIVKIISPVEKHVDFEMDLPFPAANSKYVTGNVISRDDNSYIISWYQVSSSSAKDSKGWARFIPSGNRTILIYKSFVVPKSVFAGLFKSKVVKEVKKTINALKNFVVEFKKKSPEKVEAKCLELREALKTAV